MSQGDVARDDLEALRAWAFSVRRWRLEGAEILAAYRLTWNSFEALLELRIRPMRSGELSMDLGMTTGGMAKLLARLEQLGTVSRQRGGDEDLRVVQVALTEEGARIVAEAGREILGMLGGQLDQAGATEGDKMTFRNLWWRLSWLSHEPAEAGD